MHNAFSPALVSCNQAAYIQNTTTDELELHEASVNYSPSFIFFLSLFRLLFFVFPGSSPRLFSGLILHISYYQMNLPNSFLFYSLGNNSKNKWRLQCESKSRLLQYVNDIKRKTTKKILKGGRVEFKVSSSKERVCGANRHLDLYGIAINFLEYSSLIKKCMYTSTADESEGVRDGCRGKKKPGL